MHSVGVFHIPYAYIILTTSVTYTIICNPPCRGIADVPLYAGPAQGWRLRAKLAVRDRKRTPSPSSPSDAASNAPALGLYLRGTHELLRIPECAVHSPRINAAAAAVEQAIGRTRGMTIYDERTVRRDMHSFFPFISKCSTLTIARNGSCPVIQVC